MSNGGKTNYYDLKGCKDVDALAEMLDLRGDEFNCLKAIFGIAIARKTGDSRHKGTSVKRDANKLAHYADRIKERVNKPEPHLMGATFTETKPSNIPAGRIMEIGSQEHYHFIIEKLYEEGVYKAPYGRDYDTFLKGFVNYIHIHHCDKIRIEAVMFGELAVIELV